MANWYGQPTSVWESLGQSLGQVGQSLQTWLPAMQEMVYRRDQGAYNQLEMLLKNFPADEQKQQWIQNFQNTINKSGWRDPAWSGFQWPTQTQTTGHPNLMGPQMGVSQRKSRNGQFLTGFGCCERSFWGRRKG